MPALPSSKLREFHNLAVDIQQHKAFTVNSLTAFGSNGGNQRLEPVRAPTAIIPLFGLLPRDGGVTNLISHVLTHLYSRQLFAQHPQTLGQFRINSPRKHAGQRLI